MAKRPTTETLALDGGAPVRPKDRPLPQLFPRDIHPDAAGLVKEVLDSGFTANMLGRYEAAFAEFCGARFAVGSTNCTAACHTAIAICGLERGDEVVISPISDYGSIQGVIVEGLVPVFADVDLRTGNVTAETIEAAITPRTRAAIVVGFYGLICEMGPIAEVCRKHNLVLIEDACQTITATYQGRPSGNLADITSFSTDAEKHMSTGGGGMITTHDEALAQKARRFGDGRGAEPAPGYGRLHSWLGYNYRLDDLRAAVGVAQLRWIQQQTARRRQLAALLDREIEGLQGLLPRHIPEGCSHVFWLYDFRVEPEKFAAPVEQLAAAINAEVAGLNCGMGRYYLMPESVTILHRNGPRHSSPAVEVARERYDYGPRMTPNAAEHVRRMIRWPFTDRYSEEDIADIGRGIRKVLQAYAK